MDSDARFRGELARKAIKRYYQKVPVAFSLFLKGYHQNRRKMTSRRVTKKQTEQEVKLMLMTLQDLFVTMSNKHADEGGFMMKIPKFGTFRSVSKKSRRIVGLRDLGSKEHFEPAHIGIGFSLAKSLKQKINLASLLNKAGQ